MAVESSIADVEKLEERAALVREFALSPDPTYIDENGDTRYTLAGLETLATGVPAIEASIAAQAARDALLLSGGIYPDAAAGVSAVDEGQYFSVPSPTASEHLILYRKESGAAAEKKRYPSAAAIYAYRDALSEAVKTGYPTLPIPAGGGACDNGCYVFATPSAVDGVVGVVYLYAVNTGLLKVRTLTKSGDTFTTVGEQTVQVAAGYQRIYLDLPVSAGQYLGFNGNTIVAFSNTPADSGGWYAGFGTTFTDATVSSNIRMHIRLDVLTMTRLTGIDATLAGKAAKSVVDGIISDFYQTKTIYIGQPGPISAGTSGLDNSLYALEQASPKSGTLAKFRCYSTGPGTVRVMVFSKSGNVFTVVQETTVAVSGGYESIDISLPISAGQYVGTQGSVVGSQSSVSDTFGWYGGAGSTSFTDSTVIRTSRLLIGFDVAYSVPKAASGGRPMAVDLPWEYMLLIGAGQSLMEGSQTTTNGLSPVTVAQEYDSLGFPAYPASPTVLLPATVANTEKITEAQPHRGEWPGLGAASAIRAALLRDNGISHTDIKSTVVVANDASGGAPIANISKGSAVYNAGIAQASALSSLSGGSAGTLAIIYGQGESDGPLYYNTDPDLYLARIKQLALDYDADLRAASGQTKRVPMICYQVCSTGRQIALKHLQAALESPLIYLVGPMYQFSYYDNLHIDSVSSRRLGAYYGEAVKAVCLDGEEWEPLRPVAHHVIGNTITLIFNKPGLVIDTALVPAQVNFGFSVTDSGGDAVTLSSVAVKNGNQVRLTCASAPGADWKVQYGNLIATGKGPFTGGAGNLRDSAGADRSFDGFPLHNWCVLFDWLI